LLDVAPTTACPPAVTQKQDSGVRANDVSWKGGLLPWLRRLHRGSKGWGGALLILDNAEQLLAAAGADQPGGSSPPDAHVRHARFVFHSAGFRTYRVMWGIEIGGGARGL
jgi:hypothetical protein